MYLTKSWKGFYKHSLVTNSALNSVSLPKCLNPDSHTEYHTWILFVNNFAPYQFSCFQISAVKMSVMLLCLSQNEFVKHSDTGVNITKGQDLLLSPRYH